MTTTPSPSTRLDSPAPASEPHEDAVLQAIRTFARGRCVLMATHSPAAQAAMMQVWYVHDGRVRTQGGMP